MSKSRVPTAIEALLKSARSGKKTRERKNPFPDMVEYVVRTSPFRCRELELARKGQKKIKVALVSMPEITGLDSMLKVVMLHKSIADTFEPQVGLERAILNMPLAIARKSEQLYRKGLAQAIASGADIICFNELALPNYDGKPPVALLKHLKQQATKHRILILAGSLHDGRTYMNNGYAFFPGCGESGYVFHKQISAIGTGERITAPPQRTVAYTHVGGLTVGSMICLDLADYNIVSAVVRAQLDLLFVSCYATVGTDALRKIARTISECLPGQVFLVNHASPGLRAAFEFDKGNARELPTTSVADVSVATLSVSIEDVVRSRTDLPGQWHRDWKWLFSENPAPEARLEPR